MTLVEPLTSVLRPNLVTWAEVDRGFFVASRGGEFIGSVDRTADEHYVSFDGTSSPIGRHDTLEAAKAAVLAWEPEEKRVAERKRERVLMPFATLVGAVASVVSVWGYAVTLTA